MKFEHTDVWGFSHALRGMRNPLESWGKTDSFQCDGMGCRFEQCPVYENGGCEETHMGTFIIGPNDLDLAKRLIAGGAEHRKFLRQIFVAVDITAPLFWWKEFDTYKIGTVANSTSTMHKIASKPIDLSCFETDDYQGELIYRDGKPDNYTDDLCVEEAVEHLLSFLEIVREKYLETKDKRLWKELVRWLPEGWLQTRTVTLNYENLRTIFHQRKDHKLNEWSGKDDPTKPNFVAWVKTLPYAEEFILN